MKAKYPGNLFCEENSRSRERQIAQNRKLKFIQLPAQSDNNRNNAKQRAKEHQPVEPKRNLPQSLLAINVLNFVHKIVFVYEKISLPGEKDKRQLIKQKAHLPLEKEMRPERKIPN